MNTRVFVLFLMAAFGLAGCGDDVNNPDCYPACAASQCMVCEDGRCVSSCTVDQFCDTGSGTCVSDEACDPACDADMCMVCYQGTCVSTCSTGQVCDNGNCVADNTCDPACDAGQCLVCDEGSCVSSCTAGQICDNGSCVADNTCDPACDAGQCLVCEDGSCVSLCTVGQICDNGSCVADNTCDPTCDAGQCLVCEDGSCVSFCTAGQTCENGSCVVACQNECPGLDVQECIGQGFRHCGEYNDTDDCLEWSEELACPANHTCDSETGHCQPDCGDFCDDFSIILLPDTQYYADKMADNASNTYYKQMQWIIDNENQKNIKFVIHLGDITNNNTVGEWIIADQAHAMLDTAGVPYSMVPGNHDYLSSSGFSRGATLYGDYFGSNRFTTRSWYGGSMNASSTNNYTFFDHGDLHFMVVSVEYAPRKDALCWAEEVIANHPDHRVIVATHCYLSHDGAYGTNCPNSTYDVTGSDGATVWSELASRHSNIFMVVSGHIGDSEYVPRTGNNANMVHQILVDYQFEATCTAGSPSSCTDNCWSGNYTGNGWLRELVFSPRNNQVRALTHTVEAGNSAIFPGGVPSLFCSPHNTQGKNYYQDDPTQSDHDYQFAYDLLGSDPYVWDDLANQTFNDLTVNSAGSGDQLNPEVALADDGSFIVVWEDNSDGGDGAGMHDIMVRGFSAGGCEHFADLVVNSNTAGQQQTPSVAMDQNGNFVVVWADDADENGIFQIRARGFNSNGTQRFADMTVNSVGAGQQLNPVVAMAPDGRFVVAWEDDVDYDENYQVFARGFNADGSERFADIGVNENLAGQHIEPAVDMDGTGRFVVTYQDDSDGNGTYQIHAVGFSADGSVRLPRFTVNTESAGQQIDPTLGMDAAGDFTVAWADDQDGNGTYQVLARGFEEDGSQRFADLTVNSQSAGQQLRPTLSMAPNGRFAVAWKDDQDSNGVYQILARGFELDGSEWFADLTVNSDGDGDQLDPHAAVNNDGTLVVAWEDDMDSNGYWQILARGLGL